MVPGPETPTPWELLDHPELAVLTLLESAVTLTSATLCASHPQLSDPDYENRLRPGDSKPLLAENIIAAGNALLSLLGTYRRALTLSGRRPVPGDGREADLPF